MKRLLITAWCLVICVRSATSMPLVLHDTGLHARITEAAVRSSQGLQNADNRLDGELLRISGTAEIDALALLQPFDSYKSSSATQAIMLGSVIEDGLDNPDASRLLEPVFPGEHGVTEGWKSNGRVLGHFEDGINYMGIGCSGTPASEWGMGISPVRIKKSDDLTIVSYENELDWNDAVKSLHRCIVEDDPSERSVWARRGLIALGACVHLAQDLTSPPHARNDAHVWGHGFLGPELNVLTGGSTMEESEASLLHDGYLAGPLSRTSGARKVESYQSCLKATAQFTATHFFSDDTLSSRSQPPPIFGSGVDLNVYDVRNIKCAAPRWDEDKGDYYVVSRDLGVLANTILATFRSLPAFTLPGSVGYPTLSGSECDGDMTMDASRYRCVLSQLEDIIPRAIGTSTSLIDHFFRRQLVLTQEGEKLRIRIVGDVTKPTQPGRPILVVEDATTVRRTELPLLDSRVEGDLYGGGLLVPGIDQALRALGISPGGSVDGRIRLFCSLVGARDDLEGAFIAGCCRWAPGKDCRPRMQVVGVGPSVVPVGDINNDGSEDVAYSDGRQVICWSQLKCAEVWRTTPVETAKPPMHVIVEGLVTSARGKEIRGTTITWDAQYLHFLLSAETGQAHGATDPTEEVLSNYNQPSHLLELQRRIGDQDGDGVDDWWAASGDIVSFQGQPIPGDLAPVIKIVHFACRDQVEALRVIGDLHSSGVQTIVAEVPCGRSGSPLYPNLQFGLPDVDGDGVGDFLALLISDGETSHQSFGVVSGNGRLIWSKPIPEGNLLEICENRKSQKTQLLYLNGDELIRIRAVDGSIVERVRDPILSASHLRMVVPDLDGDGMDDLIYVDRGSRLVHR